MRRSCGNSCIRYWKPLPSSPKMFDVGRRTLSKNSSDVSCAFMPSFSRLRPRLKPARSRSTRMSDVPLAPAGWIGLGDDDDEVGVLAVGDEGLRAVEDDLVARADGGGLDALQVGTGAGFGHGDGRDDFAARHLRQPVLLLFFRAVVEDVGRDDVVVQRKAGAGICAARQFFDDDGAHQEVAAGAAVFFWECREQKTGFAGFQPSVAADAPSSSHLA